MNLRECNNTNCDRCEHYSSKEWNTPCKTCINNWGDQPGNTLNWKQNISDYKFERHHV